MLSGIGATALFVSMALVGVASAFFIGIADSRKDNGDA